MDLKDAQAKKTVLEETIALLLNNFSDETGLVVSEVHHIGQDVTCLEDVKPKYHQIIEVEVRL